MAIRPRLNSVWHDYTTLFDDLRSGRLTQGDYSIMLEEDSIELGRIVSAAHSVEERYALAYTEYAGGRTPHLVSYDGVHSIEWITKELWDDWDIQGEILVRDHPLYNVMLVRYPADKKTGKKIKGLCAPTYLGREDTPDGHS